jgi:hypothetical protein
VDKGAGFVAATNVANRLAQTTSKVRSGTRDGDNEEGRCMADTVSELGAGVKLAAAGFPDLVGRGSDEPERSSEFQVSSFKFEVFSRTREFRISSCELRIREGS